MDPSLAAPLATLASAIATAILMFAAYHWPAGHNEHEDESRSEKRHKQNTRRRAERLRNNEEDAQREVEDSDE